MTKLTLWLVFMLSSFWLYSQNPEDIKLTNALFIQDAQVMTQAGAQMMKASISIKNGKIIDIGKDLKVPADAIVLKGDSLYVYPAFIDPCSHTGLKKQDAAKKEKEDESAKQNLFEKAQIVPQRSAQDLLDPMSKSVGDMRLSGFAISHAMPEGNMLAGQSALIILDDRLSPLQLGTSPAVYATFDVKRGSYPSTLIGAFAVYRDMFKNAQYAQEHIKRYQANPNQLDFPSYDQEIISLFPLINKEQQLYFHAEKPLDVARAIALQNDLKLQFTLVGLENVSIQSEAIKANPSPILLSLKLPKKPEFDTTKVLDDETKAFQERQMKAYHDRISQAAFCEQNNIAFSFSYLDVKPSDILGHIRLMIENGLSEKTALMALTSTPAKMLKMDNRTGTIEKGKLANLILVDTTLFTKDAQIQYTIINGQVYEFDKKARKKNPKIKGNEEILGTWSYEIEIPGDSRLGKMKFEKSGERITGSMSREIDSDDFMKIEDLEIDGNKVRFSLEVMDGNPIAISGQFTVDGSDFEGSLTAGNFGTFPLKGTKIAEPKNRMNEN